MGTFKLGIMGGSFDPVHNGHLEVAGASLERFNLTEILFVPAYCPPHKSLDQLAPARHRFAMLELAIRGFPRFHASRIEMDRKCPVYAGETIEAIRRQYGDEADIYFITGIDAIMTIINWDSARTYPGISKFIAAARPGYSIEQFEKNVPEAFKQLIFILHDTSLAVSSTEIRSRIKEGAPIDGMVPDSVRDYIYLHKLYGGKG